MLTEYILLNLVFIEDLDEQKDAGRKMSPSSTVPPKLLKQLRMQKKKKELLTLYFD